MSLSQLHWDSNLALFGRGLGGSPWLRGRVRCPRASLQPALGRLWASSPSALGPGRVWHAGLRDRQARVTPAQRIRKTCPATSQEAWPEAESLAMRDSLGREPRWNADRCAPLR